jgi:hypothetical protein
MEKRAKEISDLCSGSPPICVQFIDDKMKDVSLAVPL